MLSFGADVINFMCEFDLVVVILYLTAMKYAVFGDSYVARLGRSDLPLCLPGEVRFFGRGGMRAGHVPMRSACERSCSAGLRVKVTRADHR